MTILLTLNLCAIFVNPCHAEYIKMPRPLLIFSQLIYLIRVVDTNSTTEWQIVQIQISWLLQKPTDLNLHCLQRQDISGFSMTRVKLYLYGLLGTYFLHSFSRDHIQNKPWKCNICVKCGGCFFEYKILNSYYNSCARLKKSFKHL